MPAGLPFVREPDVELTLAVELYRTEGGWSQGGERVRLAEFYPRLLPWLISLRPSEPVEATGPLQIEGTPVAPGTVLEVRRWIAILSALAVPLTYALARQFVRAPAALFAAAWMATSLLAVLFGHQARPHGATTTTTLLALLACVHAAGRPARGSWLLAGAACGVAASTLHNGLALLPALAVALWIAAPTRARAWTHALLAALPLAALLWFSYPTWLRGLHPHLRGDGGTLDLSGHEVPLDAFDGGGLHVLWRTFAGFEPTLGLAAAGAVAAWWFRRPRAPLRERPALAVVLAFALPYLAVLAVYRNSYERFLSPLLPVLAIAGAWGLERLLERQPQRRRSALALGLGGLLLLPGLASSVKLDALFLGPHSTRLMADWLVANVPPDGARIGIPANVELPLEWCPVAQEAGDASCATRFHRVTLNCDSPEELALFQSDPRPKLRQWKATHFLKVEPHRPRAFGPMHSLNRWLDEHAERRVVLPDPGVGVLGGGPLPYQDADPLAQPLYLARLWRAGVVGPRLSLWAARDAVD